MAAPQPHQTRSVPGSSLEPAPMSPSSWTAGKPVNAAGSPALALQSRLEAEMFALPVRHNLAPAARAAMVAGLALASWAVIGALGYSIATLIG